MLTYWPTFTGEGVWLTAVLQLYKPPKRVSGDPYHLAHETQVGNRRSNRRGSMAPKHTGAWRGHFFGRRWHEWVQDWHTERLWQLTVAGRRLALSIYNQRQAQVLLKLLRLMWGTIRASTGTTLDVPFSCCATFCNYLHTYSYTYNQWLSIDDLFNL